MTSPDIQRADPASSDAAACLAAYAAELNRLFPEGFAPGPLSAADREALRPPRGGFLIARAEAALVGCVALRRHDETTGEVKRLWVAPDWRRGGLASRLMAAVEAEARSLGMTRLVLDTSRHLPEAVAFYRRWGWRDIDRYNDNPHAHHFFEKSLT
jgi:GNAT superfamily N-acetyltransferase